MWLPPETIEPPDGSWIELDVAKTFLRADSDTSEDGAITGMIAAVLGHIEAYTGTRMLTQTVKLRAASFDDLVRLPIGPVQSVSQVEYLDRATGSAIVLDSGIWESFGAGLAIGLRPQFNQRWPAARLVEDAIRVTAVVGYGSVTDIPGPVIAACQLLLGDFYMNREDTIAERGVTPATLPNGVDAQLANFRIY